METWIVGGIGLTALGYVVRRAWRGLNGKNPCSGCPGCSGQGCPASRGFVRK